MATTADLSTGTDRPLAAPIARRGLLFRLGRMHAGSRLLLALLSLVYLLPFYWMIVIALKPVPELSVSPPTLWPHAPRLANFADAVTTFPFWLYLRNTTFVTLMTVVGVALAVPIVAYGFSRIEWPGRDQLFMVVLATVFIPYPALIIALFDIFAGLGWINTYKPLIVPFFFCFLPAPFWIFLLRQFFLQIPQDLTDAARLDGASDLRILYQVIMPQSWPALVAVSLFAALHAWNDFLGPLLYLQDAGKYTLSIGLTFFQSQSRYDVQVNLLMAASALVILPVVLIFLSFQRAFVEGVTVGGLK